MALFEDLSPDSIAMLSCEICTPSLSTFVRAGFACYDCHQLGGHHMWEIRHGTDEIGGETMTRCGWTVGESTREGRWVGRHDVGKEREECGLDGSGVFEPGPGVPCLCLCPPLTSLPRSLCSPAPKHVRCPAACSSRSSSRFGSGLTWFGRCGF